MITSKYNFKNWLRKTYPAIAAVPVYGVPAYILSKELKPEDMFIYNVQQLKDGRFIVFVGVDVEDIKKLKEEIESGSIQVHRTPSKIAPTTFNAFEEWLKRNNIKPFNRTWCPHMTPKQALRSEVVSACISTEEMRTWYLYELPLTNGETLTQEEEIMYSKLPHTVVTHKFYNNIAGEETKGPEQGYVLCVLVKAYNSKYVSKKQRFLSQFNRMQPIYEQLIQKVSEVLTLERVGKTKEAEEGWDEAKLLCEQYMGIQFEYEGEVDMKSLKEASYDNTLGLFTRDRRNYKPDTPEASF